MDIAEEFAAFRRRRTSDEGRARQRAAFFLMSGIDLDDALSSAGPSRRQIVLRLSRLIERERLRGARRHWSYDLNRHIALKQALDSLQNGAAEA